ncbi:MAG: NAD(P)-dependent oxidoreductase, partial [Comamonadaceae bacterium]
MESQGGADDATRVHPGMGRALRGCRSQHRDILMKVAVTGASGFVGRHVLRALHEAGSANVTAVSRSEPGPWLPGGFDHVQMDLQSPPAAPFEVIGSPDVLIHLAWGGLPHYDSRHHFEVELPSSYGFLKALVDHGLPSLLCVGTCFEYGMVNGALHESNV